MSKDNATRAWDALEELLAALGLDPRLTSRLTISGREVEAEVATRRIPGQSVADTTIVRFQMPREQT